MKRIQRIRDYDVKECELTNSTAHCGQLLRIGVKVIDDVIRCDQPEVLQVRVYVWLE